MSTPRRPLWIVLAVALVGAIGGGAVLLTRDDDTATDRPSTTTTTDRAAVTSAPTTAAGATGAPPSSAPFRVVGARIVDPDGNVFVPMGANVAVRLGQYEEGYAFNWNGTATDHAADVAAWGWNTVRATLVCDPDGAEGGDGPTREEIDAGIDAFIEEYTARRIVVMVECHDITGDDPAPDDPKVGVILDFFDRLAARWKDQPYVWFNPLNEPQTGVDADAVANWTALQTEAYDRVRAHAPRGIYVADIPGHAQGLSTLTGRDAITSFGGARCNVVYAWHAYGAVGQDGAFGTSADDYDEQRSLAAHRKVFDFLKEKEIPMVIGEVGDPLTLDEGTAGDPVWNRNGARAVMSLAPEYGVGMLWWHATGDSGVFLTYSLMADRRQPPWSAGATGEGLSDGGRRFWEASKQVAAAPKVRFDGEGGGCP